VRRVWRLFYRHPAVRWLRLLLQGMLGIAIIGLIVLLVGHEMLVNFIVPMWKWVFG
jgi:hypothetical protein